MFGMSREERRRLDAAEKIAGEARDLGSKSLAEIASHTAVCTERHGTITRRLDGIDGVLKWVNRQGIVMLLLILGAILLGIAEHKGLF